MRAWLLCAVAAIAGGLVYLNALHNPFVFDDQRVIVDNASIEHLSDIRGLVAQERTRPLTNVSYAIDDAIWGRGPEGFHLTSVGLHIANVALLFWTVAAISRRAWAAFIAAVFFAVHPMMSQAVGYISARPDLLWAFFFLLAFLAARRWLLGGGWGWWVAAFIAWVGAQLSKETAVMFPAVIFCFERLVPGASMRSRQQSLWRLHVPLFAVAIGAGAARLMWFVFVEQGGASRAQVSELLTQAVVAWRYAGLLLRPSGQTIFHDVRSTSVMADALAVAGILVALGVAFVLRQRSNAASPLKLASFGLLWFLLLVAPSAVLGAYGQVQPMAEHRVYLASCGLFMIAGMAGEALVRRAFTQSVMVGAVASLALGVLLLSLGARTLLRNAIWSDPVALWREASALAPEAWLPHKALAESLHAAGRHADAAVEYRTAIGIDPQDETAYLNLATCLSELGQRHEAKAAIEALQRVEPESPAVPTGFGAVALLAGDLDDARSSFSQALQKDPRYVMAIQWMAVLEERAADPAAARARCEQVQRLTPGLQSTRDCIQRNDRPLISR